MLLLWTLACAEPPEPAPAPRPLTPEYACPDVPDDVVGGLAPWTAARRVEIADRVGVLGEEARCPAAIGPDGWVAVTARSAEGAGVVVARRWAGAPVEVLVARPLPLDLEQRIAGSGRWLSAEEAGDRGPTLEIRWCDAQGCPCSELVWGFDAAIRTAWTCPDRPGPPPLVDRVPWPDPVDREG